jgi:hypothetical protein
MPAIRQAAQKRQLFLCFVGAEATNRTNAAACLSSGTRGCSGARWMATVCFGDNHSGQVDGGASSNTEPAAPCNDVAAGGADIHAGAIMLTLHRSPARRA